MYMYSVHIHNIYITLYTHNMEYMHIHAVFHLEGGKPWDFPPLVTSFPPPKILRNLIKFSIYNAKYTNAKS